MPGEFGGTELSSFDMGSALAEMGTDLGFGGISDNGGGGGGNLSGTGTGSDVALDSGKAFTGETGGTVNQLASDKPKDTPQPQALEAPKTWRKEATSAWAALPAVVQAEVLKREDDIFKGLETYKEHAQFGKSMQTALAPYMPVLQRYNIDPVSQVQGLMQAHYTLATGTPEQKLAFINKIAADYGINLSQPASEAPYTDPAVSGLQARVHGVESQLQALETKRQTELRQSLEQEIDAFSKDPANTYFQELANDMVPLLQSGVCKTLKDAYEKALWGNPAVRQKELARQQTEQARKKAEEAAAKVDQARKAAAVNVRSSAKGGGTAAPVGSIDDTMNKVYDEIASRS